MNFRRADPADVDAVVALVESAYRGESSRAGWTTEADLLDGRRTGPDEITAVIADDNSRMLLLEDGAELVGCALVTRPPLGPTARFGMFAVRPAGQRRGAGSRLLARAEAVAVGELDADVMEMTVIVHRVELISYYERRGYRDTGERRAFPAHDVRFGVPRRADLEFMVLAKLIGGVSSQPRTS